MKVNNKALKGFSSDLTQYSYLMKESSSKAPIISATSADPKVIIEVVQAKGVPGTATISLFDYITYDKMEYVVNLGVESVSDEFDADKLGEQWQWIRENASAWSLSNKSGSLVITSSEGDLIEANNNAKNVFLQSANTDWTIETKIVCSRKPSGFTENAGLLAYQDDDNFVKLSYRPSFGRGSFRPGGSGQQPVAVELYVENAAEQLSSVQLSVDHLIKDDNAVLLKLEKKGSIYTAYCSSDGKNFEKVGEAEVILKDVQAGMVVNDGAMPARFAGFRRFMQQPSKPETPLEVAFDYFRIENTGLK